MTTGIVVIVFMVQFYPLCIYSVDEWDTLPGSRPDDPLLVDKLVGQSAVLTFPLLNFSKPKRVVLQRVGGEDDGDASGQPLKHKALYTPGEGKKQGNVSLRIVDLELHHSGEYVLTCIGRDNNERKFYISLYVAMSVALTLLHESDIHLDFVLMAGADLNLVLQLEGTLPSRIIVQKDNKALNETLYRALYMESAEDHSKGTFTFSMANVNASSSGWYVLVFDNGAPVPLRHMFVLTVDDPIISPGQKEFSVIPENDYDILVNVSGTSQDPDGYSLTRNGHDLFPHKYSTTYRHESIETGTLILTLWHPIEQGNYLVTLHFPNNFDLTYSFQVGTDVYPEMLIMQAEKSWLKGSTILYAIVPVMVAVLLIVSMYKNTEYQRRSSYSGTATVDNTQPIEDDADTEAVFEDANEDINGDGGGNSDPWRQSDDGKQRREDVDDSVTIMYTGK